MFRVKRPHNGRVTNAPAVSLDDNKNFPQLDNARPPRVRQYHRRRNDLVPTIHDRTPAILDRDARACFISSWRRSARIARDICASEIKSSAAALGLIAAR
jgi:hypothetical protein